MPTASVREVSALGTLGLGTCCHRDPFQCWIRPCVPPFLAVQPTAQQLTRDWQVAPSNPSPMAEESVGELTTCQRAPSQREIRVRTRARSYPTPQHTVD